jgi:hypothetical protein
MQDFLTFARERFGPNWVICRKTQNNIAKYGNCHNHGEYHRLRLEYAELLRLEQARIDKWLLTLGSRQAR